MRATITGPQRTYTAKQISPDAGGQKVRTSAPSHGYLCEEVSQEKPNDTKELNFSGSPNIPLTNSENRVSNEISPVILRPEEVAKLLSVSERTAIQIMKELPHINVSQDIYSGKQRIRITGQTYEDFVFGRITRRRARRGG